MSQKIVIACRGWMTDPNALASAPAGALKTARDVMIRIPNTIEPRPGFGVDSDFAPTTFTAIRSMQEWNNGNTSRYVVTNRSNSTTYSFAYNNGSAITNIGHSYTAPQEEAYNYHSFFVSRKNLYICGTDTLGPCKLTNGTDTLAQKCNAEPVIFASLTTAAGSPVTTLYSVAWRAVIKRTDGNGYVTRSAPSNYFRSYNSAGTAAYGTILVRLPDNCEAGDVVELYRSKIASGDVAVADEMYYAMEQVVTSADVGVGVRYTNLVDLCPEANLGASLYTNSSQQGVAKANDPPPASMCSALWSSCAWYGNAWARPQLLLTMLNANGTVASNNPYFGVHDFVTASNIIAGSTTVTIAASQAHNIYVGQHLSAVVVGTPEPPDVAGAVFAANTQVTAYNSTTGVVTFSPAAIGAHASGQTVYFCDAIRIGSNAGFSSYIAFVSDTGRCFNTSFTATAQETVAERVVRSLALTNIYNLALGNGSAGHIILPIEGTGAGGLFVVKGDGSVSGITVAVTTPDDFTNASTKRPPITPTQSWNSGSGTTLPNTTFYNRVYYSKPDEPEACPELNYIDIGRSDQRILRLVPLRDSLLVFKQDGIWRISGSAPDQWRVDMVSEDYRLVHSRMVTVLGETAYAWTNKGIVSVSAYGDVNKIDVAIHDQVEAVYLNNYTSLLVPTDTLASTMHAVTHERLGLVIFQMPTKPTTATAFVNPDADAISGTLGNNTTAKFCYCFCPETGAWFEWDLRGDGTTASMFHRQNGKLYFARGATSEVRVERVSGYQGKGDNYYDATYAVTIGSASATGCTIAVGATNYNYVQNDYLLQGGEYYRIGRNWATTAVILDDWSTTGSPTPISNGAATVYESIKPIIEWQPQTTGSAIGARWSEMAVHFSDLSFATDDEERAFRVTIGGASDDDSSESTDGIFPRTPKNAIYRCWVPRSLHRSHKLTPFIAMYAIQAYWKIHGMTLIYQDTSEKSRRDLSG
jgi:hypothetical protein